MFIDLKNVSSFLLKGGILNTAHRAQITPFTLFFYVYLRLGELDAGVEKRFFRAPQGLELEKKRKIKIRGMGYLGSKSKTRDCPYFFCNQQNLLEINV